MSGPDWGITFSPRQASYLGLNPVDSFRRLLTLPLRYIRLGAYWQELEAQPGVFDWQPLTQYLDMAEKSQRKIVLVIGAKSPRWPEFYLPEHVRQQSRLFDQSTEKLLLSYLHELLLVCRSYQCISCWQVENEPLDPSGPDNATIPYSLLEQESALVRKLDSWPIMMTVWGNELSKRGHLPRVAGLADVIGIDIYYQQFIARVARKNIYASPRDSDATLTKIIQTSTKPVWITELQAEPWEKDTQGFTADNPGSMSPEKLKTTIDRAQKLGAETVLLWGAEYWLWRQQQGDSRYLDLISHIL